MKKNKSKKENKNLKIKKIKNNNEIQKFKDKYFSFYNDIKDYTRGKEDWW